MLANANNNDNTPTKLMKRNDLNEDDKTVSAGDKSLINNNNYINNKRKSPEGQNDPNTSELKNYPKLVQTTTEFNKSDYMFNEYDKREKFCLKKFLDFIPDETKRVLIIIFLILDIALISYTLISILMKEKKKIELYYDYYILIPIFLIFFGINFFSLIEFMKNSDSKKQKCLLFLMILDVVLFVSLVLFKLLLFEELMFKIFCLILSFFLFLTSFLSFIRINERIRIEKNQLQNIVKIINLTESRASNTERKEENEEKK